MYLMGSTKKLIFYSLLLITLIFFLADRIYIGREIDNYKGVPIFYNGILMFDSHGKNYSKDGYYYGQKWQCVEFIKRFFYDIYGHAMPNVRGHAASYFDPQIVDGLENKERRLIQYHNGSQAPPEEDDLVVFNSTRSKFGHVAIISKVLDEYVEIVQQNQFLSSRKFVKKIIKDRHYFLGEGTDTVAGWLRLESKTFCQSTEKF